MKIINKTKGTKAIAVAVVSLAFVSVTFAQQAIKPPINGTYYSAKDFDWSPPWPFNPHPELDVVEVAPGIFIYDDTAIPDTPEQAESRKQKQEADALAKAIATDPGAYFHLRNTSDFVTWQTNAIVKADSVTNSILVDSSTKQHQFWHLVRQR